MDQQTHDASPHKAVLVRIAADERHREAALRERFAEFWQTETGGPRAIYDRFVSATPLPTDVTLEAVDDRDVQGWWVRPQAGGQGRAILYLHGGGYVQGSAKAYRGFVGQLVHRVHIPALVIDYPLAPEATLPAAPDTALRAWKWLVAQGFDRISVVGDSAGGGLALVTLAALGKLPDGPAPVAGVAFSPWLDMSFGGVSMTDPRVQDPLISHDYLRACAGKYLGATDPADPRASPLFGDLRGLPRLFIQVGTDERLLDDSVRFADRAARAGIPTSLEVWEGLHHVFQFDVEHLESSKRALDHAARFLVCAFDADEALSRQPGEVSRADR